MTEQYRRFDAADYIRTADDVRGLLRAAADEDPGDGAVIRAALKHVAQTRNEVDSRDCDDDVAVRPVRSTETLRGRFRELGLAGDLEAERRAERRRDDRR